MGLWTLYRTFDPCRAEWRVDERIYLLVILCGDCDCVCARDGQVDKGEAMSDKIQGEDERALALADRVLAWMREQTGWGLGDPDTGELDDGEMRTRAELAALLRSEPRGEETR